MKKKILIILIILILGICIIFMLKDKKEEIPFEEYIPEEEISQNIENKTIVTLYYLDKKNNILIPTPRTVNAIDLLEKPYEMLINMLLEQTDKEELKSAIPKNTKVLGTQLNGNILIVDLSKEFIEEIENDITIQENAINSIVNTLTQLNEVQQIKIKIEGKENLGFIDSKIDFTKNFVKKDIT